MTFERRRSTLRSTADLIASGLMNSEAADAIEPVLEEFSLAITPHVAEIISSADPDRAVAKQFIPTSSELGVLAKELADPIGDSRHSPVKGLVHRYVDRVLLKVLHTCPVYCRFCFRREQVGTGGEALNSNELLAALNYIAAHPAIWEVILSGGDPLILSPRKLADIQEKLSKIDHVRVLRIHSRVPVVDPDRITSDLVQVLRGGKTTYVVIHCNHPDELTPKALNACAMLADAGIPLLSQSVLLKGINDDPAVLTKLFRTLVENRVKPYYLHHGDLAKGTSHFRTTIARGQELMRSLRGQVSGICQPTFVLDIPGGHGKVPIGPGYLEKKTDRRFALVDPKGETHEYSD